MSALVILSAVAVPSRANTTYTWDTSSSDNNTITGGTGTWSTSSPDTNWTSNGGAARGVWISSNSGSTGSDALFGGYTDGTYSVTVGASFQAASITFNDSGYTLSGTSAVITMGAGGVVVASGKSATIGNGVKLTRSTGPGVTGAGTLFIGSGGILESSSSTNTFNLFGAATTATINVSGGTVQTGGGNILVGVGGTLTISSGTVNAPSTAGHGLIIGDATNAAGTVNLTGTGVLQTGLVNKGGNGTTTFTFNGGTLQAGSANNASTFMTGLTSANILDGGAKIDTNGFSVTISQSLLHSANAVTDGLTKQGAGTLTLTGANTYTGGTLVDTNAGTLLVNATHINAGAYTVNSGGTLGGSGAVTTVGAAGATVNAGGKMSPGSAAATAGTFTLNLGTTGKLDISAAVAATNTKALLFDLVGPASSDKVVVTNSTAASALNVGTGALELDDFNFSSGSNVTTGVYTLFDSNATITGTLGSNLSGTINGYIVANLSFANSGQDLVLTVTSVPEPSIMWTFGGLGIGLMCRRKYVR